MADQISQNTSLFKLLPGGAVGTLDTITDPISAAQAAQDRAARMGLDLNLFNQYSINPAAFQTQYGQFQDPNTGMFKIAGVTPGALMQNPNYAGSATVNPDGTAVRAGTMTSGTSSGGFTGLPNYGVVGVNELFDPNFGRTETQTRAAENALMGGFSGGGFAIGQGARLLDSERKANIIAGHQILEPYLNREFQGGQNAADRASRLNEIAAQGANALQQLQLSEAGATARLSASQRGELERQILSGQQAMQQLTLREAGETGRTREQIGGRLAETVLGAALTPGRTGGTAGGARLGTPGNPFTAANPSGPLGPTFYGSPSTGIAPVSPGSSYSPFTTAPYRPPGGGSIGTLLGGSSIDRILARYGLLN